MAAATGSVVVTTVGPSAPAAEPGSSSGRDRPARCGIAANCSRRYGPHTAGWVSTIRSGGPPWAWLTVSTTERSRPAIRAVGEYGVPSRMTGVGSPRRRLNSRAIRLGSWRPRRSAASPVSSAPLSSRKATDGVTRACPASGTMFKVPAEAAAAAVKLVPRSIPTLYIFRIPLAEAATTRTSWLAATAPPRYFAVLGDNKIVGPARQPLPLATTPTAAHRILVPRELQRPRTGWVRGRCRRILCGVAIGDNQRL